MDDPAGEPIMEALTQIAREAFMDDELVLTRQSWGHDIVGWSSFGLVEMILGVQERLGVVLTAEETNALESMGDLADAITRKRQR
jgi:acyl carrier protein